MTTARKRAHLSALKIQEEVRILPSPLLPGPDVTKSRLILLAVQQASESKKAGVEKRNVADQEDGRLMSQNNRLVGVWTPGSFIKQRLRGGRVRVGL